MQIPVGNFLITSDESNIILNEKRIYGKESAKAGEEYYVPVGYFSTIEGCLESVLERKIRASNAKSIGELLSEVKKIGEFIRSEFKKAREGK